MELISREIIKFLETQKLGYVASVSSNNFPNLSPKGTIIGWNSNTLAFADIRSPDTMRNIMHNPFVEINVIDPLLRRGFLFQGNCEIIKSGKKYTEILNHYRTHGVKSPINAIVLVHVTHVKPILSPLYDLGVSEDSIKSKWQKHFATL